jgi:hypothetical protein
MIIAAKKVGGMQRGKGLRACVRTQPKKPESSQRSQGPENGSARITTLRKPQEMVCSVSSGS